MKLSKQTRDERNKQNDALVDKWRKEDAPKLERIRPQWEYERQWHSWFAWFVVEVGDGDCRWLEIVDRRLKYRDFPRIMATWNIRSYEYRARRKQAHD